MSTPQRSYGRVTLTVDRSVEDDEPVPADVMAEITADRNAAAELDRVIAAYAVARAT